MLETRTFKEIWQGFDAEERAKFYAFAFKKGFIESSIRNYGTGRRSARGPARVALAEVFSKMKINVGNGQYLFKK